MKRLLLALFAAGISLSVSAQSTKARDDIHGNILLCASNYLAYVDPTKALTPAPKGYEPFYLTHYARHGSRWLIDEPDYIDPMGVLDRAHEKGKLTERGEKLRKQINEFYKTTIKRRGELTTVGEKQHHRIGYRMARNFPEIFGAKNAQVDARSTVVIRCILSMVAECEELCAYNPALNVHNDVSESYQYYLNGPWDRRIKDENREEWKRVFDFNKAYLNPTRFWSVIVNDPDYRDEKINGRTSTMKAVFDICTNMQSHYGSRDYPANELDRMRNNLPASLNSYSLFDVFTEEECYNLWRCKNIDWYVNYVSGISPFSQRNLLENFLTTADTVMTSRKYHGATLRFGHEVCVMPMAALLELGNCYPEVPMEGLDTLDHVWRNYEIYPMASNIQLVFYRRKKGKEGDVLVKAMLNEREVSLPVKTNNYPYYRWEDLRAYYLGKLDKFDRK